MHAENSCGVLITEGQHRSAVFTESLYEYGARSRQHDVRFTGSVRRHDDDGVVEDGPRPFGAWKRIVSEHVHVEAGGRRMVPQHVQYVVVVLEEAFGASPDQDDAVPSTSPRLGAA